MGGGGVVLDAHIVGLCWHLWPEWGPSTVESFLVAKSAELYVACIIQRSSRINKGLLIKAYILHWVVSTHLAKACVHPNWELIKTLGHHGLTRDHQIWKSYSVSPSTQMCPKTSAPTFTQPCNEHSLYTWSTVLMLYVTLHHHITWQHVTSPLCT